MGHFTVFTVYLMFSKNLLTLNQNIFCSLLFLMKKLKLKNKVNSNRHFDLFHITYYSDFDCGDFAGGPLLDLHFATPSRSSPLVSLDQIYFSFNLGAIEFSRAIFNLLFLFSFFLWPKRFFAFKKEGENYVI